MRVQNWVCTLEVKSRKALSVDIGVQCTGGICRAVLRPRLTANFAQSSVNDDHIERIEGGALLVRNASSFPTFDSRISHVSWYLLSPERSALAFVLALVIFCRA